MQLASIVMTLVLSESKLPYMAAGGGGRIGLVKTCLHVLRMFFPLPHIINHILANISPY